MRTLWVVIVIVLTWGVGKSVSGGRRPELRVIVRIGLGLSVRPLILVLSFLLLVIDGIIVVVVVILFVVILVIFFVTLSISPDWMLMW